MKNATPALPLEPASVPMPRSDRRRQRTRAAIIAAGQHLFATRSLEGVSIDDIVAAADVAKGSFYNHFDHKEGLADTIIERVQDDTESHVHAANRNIVDPALRITRALAVMVAYARAHPDRVQAMVSLSRRRLDIDSPLNAGVVGDVTRGLDTGRFKGVSPATGVLVVIALVRTAVDHITQALLPPTPDVLVADLGAALLRALGVDSKEASDIALAATQILATQEVCP